ncbi:ABC transporter substrate-binding protein [Caldanaerobacter subterraneus]|uniref:ABC transporter substrate-binding protein n=1 Tax=Caldanaerobacter subterraneus TaxID=911092 RepID=A0A7Y2L7Q2_9THEO|nr:ABC transporter substrate-binding protein [Caldanaerobacter subterraneus]NNG66855.1 ABC transporter substrate-binding protein [Caldanaerobacter subterraneus]
MAKKLVFRRLLTVLIIIAFTFSAVVGCSSKPQSQSSAKKEPIKLTILTHYSQEQEEALKKEIEKWNKLHPDIQVVHKPVGDFGQLLPTIMAQQTAGQQADIIHIYALWLGQLVSNRVLAEVPDDVVNDIKQNYMPTAIDAVTFEGKVWGYPTEIQTYGLFYNKKLLKEAGFDNAPNTWNEVYEMAKKITKKDSTGKMLIEGFGLVKGWDSAVVHPFLSLAYSAGGVFIKDGKVDLTTPPFVEALQFEEKLIKDGITDISFDTLKGFADGKVGMVINAGWWNSTLKVLMKEDYQNVGVTTIPSPDRQGKGSVAYGFLYGVNSKSKHKNEAWEFLKWLNSEAQENGATPEGNFLVSLDIIPTRISDINALKSELEKPNNKPFIDALSYAIPELNVVPGQKIKTILQNHIESVWVGSEKVEEALKAATNEINQELEKYAK